MGKPMANGHPISGVATRKEFVRRLAETCGPKILEEVELQYMYCILLVHVLYIISTCTVYY